MARARTRRERAWLLLAIVLLVCFGGFPASPALNPAIASSTTHGEYTHADESPRDRGNVEAVVPALPSPLRGCEPGKVWLAAIAPSGDLDPRLTRTGVHRAVMESPASQSCPPALGRSPPDRQPAV